MRVIHFQDPFRLVILTATKNFIANDYANSCFINTNISRKYIYYL